ncbi:MAG: HD domain-containing protein [Phycisphaerae bacterium]|jgi:HD-GYP domain-containing protein (c-di-GMP phosphodiesterase class II)|nr:HD domain-containing protein [Phycisphaerae bacterium]
MDMIRATALRHTAMLESIAENLNVRLADLGVHLSVRDDEGVVVGQSDPCCEFCQVICNADESCDAVCAATAASVMENSAPEFAKSKIGCSVMALPVKRRRRVIGSVTVCMPVDSMLAEEHFSLICDQLQLDREAMVRLGREACDNVGISPEHLTGLLEQMLAAETICHTSTEELDTLSRNLAKTYEELSLVYRISGSMQLTQTPEGYLKNVCSELVEVMGVSTALAIVYPHTTGSEDRDMIVVAGGCGLDNDDLALLASKYMVPRFGPENLGVVDNHFEHEEHNWPYGQVRRIVSVPLVTDGPRSGILIGIDKLDREFDSFDLKLLRSIGNQSAVFLANSRLYGDLEGLLMGVLHALSATIDAKDPYTCGHSRRVALISRRLAEKIGFDAKRVHRIYLAGLLHDIGKIGVPEAVLCKAGKLTEDEYAQMKNHPRLGAKILGGIRQLDDVIPGILCHHERLDGKGYPNGLNSGELSMDSLIVGIADSFDAMTSDRTYRKALPVDVVRKEIEDNAGLQFAPSLVAEMLSWDLQALLDELHKPAETVVLSHDPGSTT